MSAQLFKVTDELAVNFNPSGRFHGWLFRQHRDGHWISVRKLEPVEEPAKPLLAPDAGEGEV